VPQTPLSVKVLSYIFSKEGEFFGATIRENYWQLLQQCNTFNVNKG
jgi:hypothetical protein